MGIVVSFVTAIVDAFNNTFIKKGLKKHSTLVVSLSWALFSLIILVPSLLLIGIPVIRPSFWWSAGIKVGLQTLAYVLYAASLRKTDISQAIPMLALTPPITIVISYFLNGDVPSVLGVVGVVVVFFGVWMLNNPKKQRALSVAKSIFDNKGVFYMFLVALIWGVTTSLDRVAVKSSSPIFYTTFVAIFISLILAPIVFKKHKKEMLSVFKSKNFGSLLRVGIADGVVQLTQMTAVGLTLAAYVIAIKRSSIIISSVLGRVFFKENIRKRIIPISMMFAGILLIVLFK